MIAKLQKVNQLSIIYRYLPTMPIGKVDQFRSQERQSISKYALYLPLQYAKLMDFDVKKDSPTLWPRLCW